MVTTFFDAFAFDFPKLLAAVNLTILPSILVYIALQAQIQRTLAEGGVRG